MWPFRKRNSPSRSAQQAGKLFIEQFLFSAETSTWKVQGKEDGKQVGNHRYVRGELEISELSMHDTTRDNRDTDL